MISAALMAPVSSLQQNGQSVMSWVQVAGSVPAQYSTGSMHSSGESGSQQPV